MDDIEVIAEEVPTKSMVVQPPRFYRPPFFHEQRDRTMFMVGDRPGRAVMYPQVQGYLRPAIVVPQGGESHCVDVYVWLEGECEQPEWYHYCDVGQFIAFVDFVEGIIEESHWHPAYDDIRDEVEG